MADTAEPNRKLIFMSHVYAGSRVKHKSTGEIENLW